MLSDRLPALSSALLFLLLYQMCVLLGATQLQGSAIGTLLVLITAFTSFESYKQVWRATWPAWLLIVGVLVGNLGISELVSKSAKGGYDALRALLLFFVAASIVCRADPDKTLPLARHFFVAMSALILVSYIVIAVAHGAFSLRDNPILAQQLSGIHEYASVIAAVMLGLISLWVADRKAFSSLHKLCLLVLGFILAMSDSLGAYLALSMCALFMLQRFFPRTRILWWLGTSSILVAFIYIAYIHVGSEIFGLQIPHSFVERKELFEETYGAIRNAPWFGYGLNTYKFVGAELGWRAKYIMPHNIYLELVFSVGLIGSVLLLLGFVTLYRAAKPLQSTEPFNNFWLLLAQLLIIYLAFRGLTELRLGFKTWGLLAVSLGVIMGVKCRASAAHQPC